MVAIKINIVQTHIDKGLYPERIYILLVNKKTVNFTDKMSQRVEQIPLNRGNPNGKYMKRFSTLFKIKEIQIKMKITWKAILKNWHFLAMCTI